MTQNKAAPGKDFPQVTKPKKVPADSMGKRLSEEFRRYRDYKRELDDEIVENEDWWQGRGWQHMKSGPSGRRASAADSPTTPYLFNAIWNKHASAMDSYPEPAFIEREEGDREEAERLSKIVPLILERGNFTTTYSDAWWKKLKNGFAVYFVYWDKDLEGGLGDIGIRVLDGLRFYAEPDVTDVQDSRYIFIPSVMDMERAKQLWPKAQLEQVAASWTTDVKRYYSQMNELSTDKVCVVDCYEKQTNERGNPVVHLTKFAGDRVLYSTKTDPQFKDKGLYDHGMYPFVIDTMIPVEKSLYGMGMIRLGKSMQGQIDKMDRVIERTNLVASRQRFLVKRSAGVDRNALLDLSQDIVDADASVDDNAVRPIQASGLPAAIYNTRQSKALELKEVLGNRDVSQGGTSGGITAYSAIAALQETGNKLDRDLINASYESYRQLMYFVIELIRQFYTEERVFRIVGEDKRTQYVHYSNEGLRPRMVEGVLPPLGKEAAQDMAASDGTAQFPALGGQVPALGGQPPAGQLPAEQPPAGPAGELPASTPAEAIGEAIYEMTGGRVTIPEDAVEEDAALFRKPVFDISVTAQKQNPFSTVQHNQMCIQLYQLGAFQPENAVPATVLLDNMIIPNKDKLLKAVEENGNLQQKMEELAAEVQSIKQALAGPAAQAGSQGEAAGPDPGLSEGVPAAM